MQTTVSFTGHRDYKGDDSRLEYIIEQLYTEGFRTFMSGMAEGFDLAAAEAVLRIKQRLPEICLVCVIPFEGHIATMNRENSKRYDNICSAADKIITLSSTYTYDVYNLRNDYLVDNASVIVSYYCGKARSGTGYTIARALKRRIRTINLYADGEQIRFFG